MVFIYWYVRKEAVLSVQIEGTQSQFSDLFLYEKKETSGVPIEDVEEVSQYILALQFSLKRSDEGFPLASTDS